jgi:hypothetical protein
MRDTRSGFGVAPALLSIASEETIMCDALDDTLPDTLREPGLLPPHARVRPLEDEEERCPDTDPAPPPFGRSVPPQTSVLVE